MRPGWSRTPLAFLTAAAVAWLGVAAGQALRARGGPGEPGGALLLYLVFGWPFALAAALALVPVYALLRSLGRVSASGAAGVGAVAGLGVAAVTFAGSRFHLVWYAGVGATAGLAWWRVWRGGNLRGHRSAGF